MTELKVGLVGAGWMGKAHAMSYRTARLAFGGKPVAAVLEVVADANEEIAARAGRRDGIPAPRARLARGGRGSRDRHHRHHHPERTFIFDIAMAAIAAGKHIYCEKPLTNDVATSLEMAEAAEKAGITTMVGFNYIKNPVPVPRAKTDRGRRDRLRHVLPWPVQLGFPRPSRHTVLVAQRKGASRVRRDSVTWAPTASPTSGTWWPRPIEEVMCDLRIEIGERPRAADEGAFSQDAEGRRGNAAGRHGRRRDRPHPVSRAARPATWR